MIVNVSLRLLYLIFDRLLGWLLLLGRTPAFKEASQTCVPAGRTTISGQSARTEHWHRPLPCARSPIIARPTPVPSAGTTGSAASSTSTSTSHEVSRVSGTHKALPAATDTTRGTGAKDRAPSPYLT
jgi:hypothetical protein